jgi:hypothetical protein
MQVAADDSKIDVVQGMLAGESSELVRVESGSGAPDQSGARRKRVSSLEGEPHKRTCQTDSQAESVVVKKKKRLRPSSNLEPVTVPVVPNPDDNTVNVDLEDVVEGCNGVRVERYVVEEGDDEEGEETLPLVHRERRIKAGGDKSGLASVGIIDIKV